MVGPMMPVLEKLTTGRTTLTQAQIHKIRELTADWQLLADLSFADLILWVPLRRELKSWPTGYVAVAHIRPTTAATVFAHDVIGDEVSWGARPNLDAALSSGEVVRDTEPEMVGELLIKEETIPVTFEGDVIAVISRHRKAELMRRPSRLELNYREVAHHFYRMVAQGTFPYPDAQSLFDPLPRVGDGLIRLDVHGAITFASPNARSALSRLGWIGELDNHKLADVVAQIKKSSGEPAEESLSVTLSGKNLRRVEVENQSGTIELLSLPLLTQGDRIGAIVLVQNVTELRRRERELVTKDATIREIHHRVKNNLQTVSALIRLQSRRIDDEAARAALEEAIRRVASIALVHETLATSKAALVEFDQVLTSLVTHALDLSPRMNEISLVREGEIGELDSRLATPLSLIVTELMHNAIEHGLHESGSTLGIRSVRDDREITFTVFNDGAPLPPDFDLITGSNLGLQIVHTLTENELKGTMTITTDSGFTHAQVRFPLS